MSGLEKRRPQVAGGVGSARRPSTAEGARPRETGLRIVLVEDSRGDAELTRRELKRGGIAAEITVVENEREFRRALEESPPQIILSDFGLPGFDGARALEIARELAPETPFIFVSGTIGEENAVRALRDGATDYIVKGNLLRLPAAVLRALEQARERDERQRAERALRDSETGLRHAQAVARLAHVITGRDGIFEGWSDNLPALMGLAPAKVPKSTREWLELVHPEDRDAFRASSISAARSGARAEFDYRLRHADGSWIHLLQVTEPLGEPDAAGMPARWFGTLRDVTREREAAAALTASEARYRTTFEQAAVGIVHTSLEGDIRMANGTFCEMSGYSRADAIQLHIRDVTHPEDFTRSAEGRAKILAGNGTPYQRELRLVRKDGSNVWVNVTTSVVRDGGGKPLHFVSVMTDLSERKRMEQTLRDAEQRFRAIFENSIEGIFQATRDGRLIACNPAHARIMGYESPEDFIAAVTDIRTQVYVDPRDRTRLLELLDRQGSVHGFEARFRRKDGSIIWSSMSVRAVRDAKGAVSHILGMQQDITARVLAEQDLQRFRAAMDITIDSIYLTDPETLQFVYVNDTACKRLGYSREELMRKTSYEVVGKTRAEVQREYAAVVAAGDAGASSESRFVRKDGTEGWTELHRRALHVEGKTLIVTIGRDITDRKRASLALVESEARFRSLTELSSDFYWESDADHRMLRVSHGSGHRPVVGTTQIGKRRWESPSTHPDPDGWAAHRAALDARAPFRDFEVARVDPEGAERWLSISGEPVFDEGGVFRGFRGVGKDITEQRAQQKRIERLSRVYAVLSGINAAIVRIRDRAELYREVCRIVVEAGKFPKAWLGELEKDRQRLKMIAWRGADDGFFSALQRLVDQSMSTGQGVVAHAIAEGRPVISNDIENDPRVLGNQVALSTGSRSLVVLPLMSADKAVGVLVLHAETTGFFDDEEMKLLTDLRGDISFALEAMAKEERIAYLALHDPLTGLANRTLFVERLGQSMHSAGAAGGKFALASLDLERLTTVNESLGRQAGDALIRQVAERLSRAAGAVSVARVAADHFVIILPTVKGRSQAGRAAAELARGCFTDPFAVEGNEIKAAAKLGIAMFPNDGGEAETLIGNAEAALRKAKETGERQVFYTPDLTERTGVSLTLENKLRRALENDEFILHYQPKIEVVTRRIIGMEALIRWQSPELGLVPPGKFIPLMEETGMILDAGTWALKRASLDHRRWTEMSLKPPRVAVNVSAIQLRQKDFVAAVEQAIMEGLAPTGIDLEITESLIMEDIEGNIGKLREVRGLGVGLAIDDFGTGYSSLSYLAKLPVQTLKIDRSFVITMLNEPDTMTLVQTIISLAHSLRLKVVAEGVDAEEQAKVLRLLRCDEMQGYLFSKPLPFEGLTALLEGRKD